MFNCSLNQQRFKINFKTWLWTSDRGRRPGRLPKCNKQSIEIIGRHALPNFLSISSMFEDILVWSNDESLFISTRDLSSTAWKCPNSEFFLVFISHIQTEYENVQSKSLYSIQMRQNKDQKNLRIRTPFSQWWHFSCFYRLFNIVFARLSMFYGYHTTRENLIWEGKRFNYRRSENILEIYKWELCNSFNHFFSEKYSERILRQI